jgi:nucleoside-diphosphate-sugar epimerase
MKILITGGDGYIAKSLFNSLSKEFDIRIITRNDFDLTNSYETNKFFGDKNFDVVIHCAVVGGSRLKKDDENTFDQNLKMYYNLLDNQKHFNKFIHFGSGAEIYLKDSPYGFSKHVINYSIQNKPNFYNIRIFGVFDENELDTRFIKTNINKYIKREPIYIFSNKKMDYFYMKDLISVVKHYILNDNLPKVYDCIYPQTKTLLEIANMINELESHSVDINVGTDQSEDYTGRFVSIGIDYVGLNQSIHNVYNKLKPRNDSQIRQ